MAGAQVLRPLMQMQWQRLRQLYCSGEAVHHIFASSSSSQLSSKPTTKLHHRLLLFNSSFRSSYHRTSSVHLRTQALKSRDVPLLSNSTENDGDSSSSDVDADGAVKKSRNEKKRDAKRAVRWAMELANFSPLQIKLILRSFSLIHRLAYSLHN